jgi:hypothetical protein
VHAIAFLLLHSRIRRDAPNTGNALKSITKAILVGVVDFYELCAVFDEIRDLICGSSTDFDDVVVAVSALEEVLNDSLASVAISTSNEDDRFRYVGMSDLS